jgi:hypothetical protein
MDQFLFSYASHEVNKLVAPTQAVIGSAGSPELGCSNLSDSPEQPDRFDSGVNYKQLACITEHSEYFQSNTTSRSHLYSPVPYQTTIQALFAEFE